METEYYKLLLAPSSALDLAFLEFFLSEGYGLEERIHRSNEYLQKVIERCESGGLRLTSLQEKGRAHLLCALVRALSIREGVTFFQTASVAKLQQDPGLAAETDLADRLYADGRIFVLLPPAYGQNYAKSLLAFEMLRRLRPDLLSPTFWLGRIHQQRGSHEKAKELYQKASATHSPDPRVAYFYEHGKFRKIKIHSDGLGFGVHPFAYFSSSQGLGAGLGAHDDRLFDTARSAAVSLSASTRKNIVGEGRYSESALFQDIQLELHARFFNGSEDFYGVGINSKKEDRSQLVLGRWNFGMSVRRELFDTFYFRLGWQMASMRLTSGGGRVFDSSNLPDGSGSSDSGPFSELGWDSRDSENDPYRGGSLFVRGYFPTKGFGSDRTYEVWALGAHYYKSFAYRQTLGFHAGIASLFKDPSFSSYPRFGEDVYLRGVRVGRFQDKNAFGVMADYRGHLWSSIHWVAFATIGRVAPELGELFKTPVKAGGGGGLRFQISSDRSRFAGVEVGVFASELSVAGSVVSGF